MTHVSHIANWMESLAPLRLSAPWDNTGLLLGDLQREVRRVMTCLTLTPESAAEAVAGQADLVISHHPLPFRPLKRVTACEPTGRLLWQLATAGVSVYCPHTAWDSAASGINSQLAERLELRHVVPLVREVQETQAASNGLGTGRVGDLPVAKRLSEISQILSARVPHCRLRGVDSGSSIRRVGIVCGSGGDLIDAAAGLKCDLFLTGEATFHKCLEAQAVGISLLMMGHFASEKFAMDHLAELCNAEFSDLEVWGSVNEKDPVSPL
jgi:dinuclear metal center YbgI/SA1388 family protein